MTMMRYFGFDPFPWTIFLASTLLGLMAGIVVKLLFWGSTPGGQFLYIRFGGVGTFVGGFLGLCYRAVQGICMLTLQE